MYVPTAFSETRLPVLHAAIRSTGLAILASFGPEGIIASHVPMLLDEAAGPNGTLSGHVARANGQWRLTASDVPALAIFPGLDGYVSPSWYPSKKADGKAVPTWDYIAVHAYGPLAFFDDADELLAQVTRLTEKHEAGRARPWTPNEAPEEYIAKMLKAIVGFRLPITRIEGKWKLSQNRPLADRLGVVEGLENEGNAAAAELANAVAEAFPR
ncbi:MAG: FMN-binding negative transcriptional regulator [Acetobacteraceae bacterium]